MIDEHIQMLFFANQNILDTTQYIFWLNGVSRK